MFFFVRSQHKNVSSLASKSVAINSIRIRMSADFSTLDRVKLVCCVGVSTEEFFCRPWMRHFVEHYLKLGIQPHNFRLSLHVRRLGADNEWAEAFLRRFDICVAGILTGEYECYTFHERNLEEIAKCHEDDWILYADFDEYVEPPYPLAELIRRLDRGYFNVMHGRLIDRVATNGRLVAVAESPSPWEQYPDVAPLTEELVVGCPDKIPFMKKEIVPSMGHHFVLNTEMARAPRKQIAVHHFKWDATIIPRLELTLKRFQTDPRRYYWLDEVERVLAKLDGGRIADEYLKK